MFSTLGDLTVFNFFKRIFRKRNSSGTQNSESKAPVKVEVKPVSPDIYDSEISKLVEVIDNVNNGKASAPDWTYLITTCQVDKEKKESIKRIVAQQKSSWGRYVEVAFKTGVPAHIIANTHLKECSLDFSKALHNGDKIIGNGKKTWQVPKGRGPFKTWEEAAVDAILLKKSIFPSNWSTVNSLIFCQRYNGLGHQNKGLEYSPYIWAYTSHHDETGNYIADGKYSITAPIKSPGIMALMLVQSEMGLI
jgi:lysozyme family protein